MTLGFQDRMKNRVRTLLPVWVAIALTAGLAGLRPTLAAAQPTPYAVTFTGVTDAALLRLLEATSQLRQLRDEPPPSPAGLRRRADADRERLEAALHAESWYDAAVAITVGGEAPDPVVTIAITPGTAYRIRRVLVVTAPGGTPLAEAPAAALGLEEGSVAQASRVVAGEQRLTDSLGNQGYAFARITDRRVAIDRNAKAMDVTLTVTPGPLVRLGAIKVNGLTDLDDGVVRARVAWTAGQPYRPDLITKTRTDLNKLGVFASLRLDVAHQPEADGTHTVVITVTERKSRYVGLGATFTNAEGLGAQADWGHRNLFGGGEQLRLEADLGRLNIRTLNQAGLNQADEKLTAELRSPGAFAANQDMILSAAAINEHPEAYQRQAESTAFRLERRLEPHLTVTYGLAGERSDIRDTNGFTSDTLAGTPLSLAYDTTNAPLDPDSGFRLALEATPWLRINDTGQSFLVGRITQSVYQDLTGDGWIVAAGRVSLGSVLNGAILPADKRFYAGGGGSVRGYAYQAAGPLNTLGHPEGGQSLAEMGAELRIKVTDTIGVVPFLDGGNVYASVLPRPDQSLRLGTGLGVRYYTGFGPLRLDLGVPLAARRTDAPVQVYLSLGQAF